MRVKLRMTGYAPLLMHSDRLANPLDPATIRLREVTSKRRKTEEDQREIARLEWLGSLYHSEAIGPFIPGANVQSCLEGGAKLSRMGTAVKRGVFVETLEAPLEYDGPRDPQSLWAAGTFADSRTVKVTTNRTMRTRPIFRDWACTVDIEVDTSQVSLEDLRRIAEEAGRLVGLGDFRPRYGRFTAELVTLGG